ncbi:Uncharacterized protein dnm_056190 [Desulfonema magnum]|uniref:Uncharacterized protein n=1 Tax=Desulfonema magnum TaxID=45655 RepID=A0A975GR20_9BACT|nr:Uncharacterized protein dnm_056190 [Desulfonema magnum]
MQVLQSVKNTDTLFLAVFPTEKFLSVQYQIYPMGYQNISLA